MATRIEWADFDAVLFDLDGVITPTADIHEQAWAELFRDFRYTQDDYLAHIDGRPRYDGVRTFLASRGIVLPEGLPSDPPGDATVCAMGNRKNVVFNDLLAAEGITPYPGSMAVMDRLDDARIPQAVVSSSKNARVVLAAAGLDERFPVVVDGLTAAAEGLPGKPAPDMFLRAAELLGATPERSIVVEDAVSGVAAGQVGGFGFVLGVDRGGNAAALAAHGADAVVTDLADTLADTIADTMDVMIDTEDSESS
ncbi:MAG: HAD family hydrolase [Ilumatobacteraceae bacterium]